ncbi:unnamed protein product [Cuscuta epithymum]|uniref:Uncharacterized protein n=1 Tax=Cuscuta epithymum TaxID=186058 RepID=A0AAV0FIG2_9ASTE|nr:unnamed protein product [Cuscuta epithymum]
MLEMMRITHQQVLHFFLNCLLFAALLLSSALDNTISTAQAMRPLHQFNFGRNPPELINGHFHQAASDPQIRDTFFTQRRMDHHQALKVKDESSVYLA